MYDISCILVPTLNNTISYLYRSYLLEHFLKSLLFSCVYLQFVTAFLTLAFGSVTLCSENSFQNIRGALCCLALNIFHEFAYHQHNVLESEKFFVLREVNNGLYRIEAYCVAKFIGKASSCNQSIAITYIHTYIRTICICRYSIGHMRAGP